MPKRKLAKIKTLKSKFQFSRSSVAAIGLVTILGGVTVLALAAESPLPKNDPGRGLIYDGLKKTRFGPCAGLFEFKSLPGRCTSGPDPFPPGVTARTNATPAELAYNLAPSHVVSTDPGLSADTVAYDNNAPPMAWPCSGSRTDQKLIEVVYIYKAGAPNRFNEFKSSLELAVKKIQGGYVESARLTSDTPIYARFETDASCNLVFRQEVLPNVTDGNTIRGYLVLQGLTNPNRRYLGMVDSDQNPLCGLSDQLKDDQPGSGNLVNSSTAIALVWKPCWATTTPIHELEHTLGAVQKSAPNYSSASGGYHCSDNHDLMCEDGSPIVCHAPNKAFLLDCNANDYFRGGPPNAGSYLSNHWNTADAQFLERSSSFNITKLTRTSFTGSPPTDVGGNITLTASVLGGCGPSGGRVRIIEFNETAPRTAPFILLADLTLDNNNTASVSFNNLTVKDHYISAFYDGNSACYGSLSKGITQTIRIPANGIAGFKPGADAEVRAESPVNNYGRLPTMDVNGFRKSYVRFRVTGISPTPVRKATLKLYAYDGAAVAGVVYSTPTVWNEVGITWNNAPPLGPVITLAGRINAGQTTAFDVSSVVKGDGTYSFALADQEGDKAGYMTRENFFPPVLEVDTTTTPPPPPPPGPMGTITTVAGHGTTCNVNDSACRNFSGDGGPAWQAGLNYPQDIVFDQAGNYYIADSHNYRIRKVDTRGIITTIAGNGQICTVQTNPCGNGAAATLAALDYGIGNLTFDSAGNLYFSGGQRIKKIDRNGIISTFAGTGEQGFSGDGGQAQNAKLFAPQGIVFNPAGFAFIADLGNDRIRKVSSTGIITTIAGHYIPPLTGGSCANDQALNASIKGPQHLAFDPQGVLHFTNSFCVRKLASGSLTRVAGSAGYQTCGDGGATACGDGGPALSALFDTPGSLAFNPKNGILFIADGQRNRVREINANGIISTAVGNGMAGFSGDGGLATQARITPWGMAFDPGGNLFIVDSYEARVRMVTLN